jgi:hypothetical protein
VCDFFRQESGKSREGKVVRTWKASSPFGLRNDQQFQSFDRVLAGVDVDTEVRGDRVSRSVHALLCYLPVPKAQKFETARRILFVDAERTIQEGDNRVKTPATTISVPQRHLKRSLSPTAFEPVVGSLFVPW